MGLLLALLLIVFAGLGGDQPTPDPPEFISGTISVGDQEFVVPMPQDAEDPDVQPSGGPCAGIEQTRLPRTDAADIVFVLIPSDCDLQPEKAGNGSYGYYRTIDDVSDGRLVDTVTTGVGTATIVDVPYYECTNSCTDGVIRMALIALNDPAGATLQVYQPVIISNGQTQDIDIAGYVGAIIPA